MQFLCSYKQFAYFLCLLFLQASFLAARSPGELYRRGFLQRLSREIDLQIQNFKHEPFRETTPLEPLDPRWRSLGFIPFARAYGRSVYPNTVPQENERGVSLEAFATWGEVEPLAFGVRALEWGIRGLSVSVEGLVNMDTVGFIPPDSIELGVVEYFRVRWGEGSAAGAWRWHPTRIWPVEDYPGSPFCWPDTLGRLRVSPNTTQLFWLTIHTPRDIPSGRYAGSVALESERGFYRVPVFFTVLPVFLVRGGLRPNGVFVSGPQDAFACRDLARHWINAVARWYNPRLMSCSLGRDGVSFDFEIEDVFMQRLAEAGLSGPHVLFAGSAESLVFDSTLARTSRLETDTPEFYLAYAQAVQLILEHGRKKGWNTQVWGILDRMGEDEQILRQLTSRAQVLKRVMGSGIHLISPIITEPEEEEVSSLVPYLDIWLVGGNVEKTGPLENSHLWGYVPCTQRDSAGGSRLKTGFDPWRRGLEGVLLWAYNWPGGGSSWNDFDAPVMDWMLSYRDLDDNYLPTPAWEGVREGIEDIRYIKTLEELIASHPGDYPPAEDARSFLESLRLLPADPSRNLGSIIFPEEAPPSTDDSPMGIVRRLVAAYIVRLQRGR